MPHSPAVKGNRSGLSITPGGRMLDRAVRAYPMHVAPTPKGYRETNGAEGLSRLSL